MLYWFDIFKYRRPPNIYLLLNIYYVQYRAGVEADTEAEADADAEAGEGDAHALASFANSVSVVSIYCTLAFCNHPVARGDPEVMTESK